MADLTYGDKVKICEAVREKVNKLTPHWSGQYRQAITPWMVQTILDCSEEYMDKQILALTEK